MFIYDWGILFGLSNVKVYEPTCPIIFEMTVPQADRTPDRHFKGSEDVPPCLNREALGFVCDLAARCRQMERPRMATTTTSPMRQGANNCDSRLLDLHRVSCHRVDWGR